MIVLPTIPHSGTFFMLRNLFAGRTKLSLTDRLVEDAIVFDHTYPVYRRFFEPLLSKYPAITPLRDPREIVRSWQRRKRRLDVLYDICAEWAYLVDKFDIHVLPIDHCTRNESLAKFSEKVGFSLTSDWQPESSGPTVDSEICDDFDSRITQILDEFYPPPGSIGRSVAA